MKTPTAKKIWYSHGNKQTFFGILSLEISHSWRWSSPSWFIIGGGHDKFDTLASSKCYNFVLGSNSENGTIDSIMKLKDYCAFKVIHGSRFQGQSMDKIFLENDVELVRNVQVGGDMENSWMMFKHVKRLKDWTMMVCQCMIANIVRWWQLHVTTCNLKMILHKHY